MVKRCDETSEKFNLKIFRQIVHSSVMFYTDNVEICLNRAALREKFGGHHVGSDIILKMYENTLPLIKKNIDLIHRIQLVNVDFEFIELVYSRGKDLIFSITELPNWTKNLLLKL